MEPDRMHASDRSISKSENFKLDDPAFRTSRHGAVDIGNHGSGCDRVQPRNAGAGTTGGRRECPRCEMGYHQLRANASMNSATSAFT